MPSVNDGVHDDRGMGVTAAAEARRPLMYAAIWVICGGPV